MSIAKIPAILLTAWGIHVTTNEPTPTTPKGERKSKEAVDIRVASVAYKVACWLHAAIELAIILGAYWSPQSEVVKKGLEYLLPGSTDVSQIFLSPTTCAATVLTVVGSSLRYLCYREMGRHFTLHITLLKNHRLVTTGPYAFVRHPGYTALHFNFAGLFMWHFARGSWFRERFMRLAGDSTLFYFPLATFVFLLFWAIVLLRRIPAEDRLLQDHFGKEWEKWADRVPYRMVPGVY